MDPMTQIALIIGILVIFFIVLMFEIRYIRKRGVRKKFVSSRIKEKERELDRDHAFNALHTAKALRNKLNSDGIDTRKAQYIIDKADTAMSYGDYNSCEELSKVAKEELLRCKHVGILTESEDEADLIKEKGIIEPQEKSVESDEEEMRKFMVGAGSDLYLQAKFELNAASGDLEKFSGSIEDREKASSLVNRANKYFESKDYQKSLSYSFRARKILSGEIEDEAEHIEPEVTKDAEEVIAAKGGGTCSVCGGIIEVEDIFCGSCGTQIREKKCVSCGAPLSHHDKFCRKCGSKN